MTQQTRTVLKGYFNSGDIPIEGQYADLIDSAANVSDDLASNADVLAGTAGKVVDAARYRAQLSVQTIPASGASQALDLTGRSGFDLTLTAACVLSFSNPLATGYLSAFVLVIRQGGAGGYGITWPGSVKWEGAAPALTTTIGTISALSFFTVDGGTTWFGGLVGDNFV